VTQIKYKT